MQGHTNVTVVVLLLPVTCPLQHEVSLCRREQPFVVRPQNRLQSLDSNPESPPSHMETDVVGQNNERGTAAEAVPSTSSSAGESSVDCDEPKTGNCVMTSLCGKLSEE